MGHLGEAFPAGLDLFALVVAVISCVVLQRYKVPHLPDGARGCGAGDGVDPAVKVAWGREGPGRPRQEPARPEDDADIRGRQERGASW